MNRAHFAGVGFLAVVLAVAGACSTANMTTYAPVNEKTKYSDDVLLSAAKGAAEELGFRVVAGEGSSTFDTREKEVATSSIPRLSYKYTFHVETTHGDLVIDSTCIANSTTAESEFKECGDDRPARVVQLQAALRKRTLERAKTEQSKTPDFTGFGEPEAAPDAGKPQDTKAASKSKTDKDAPSDDAKTKAKPSSKKK